MMAEMTGEPGPPLRPLLSGALGRDAAGADPDVVLATARANALPLTPIAAELALDTSPRWAEATAAEAAQGRVRGTTVDLVVQALGPLAPGVAWCAPRWRPASGTDVDLVAPPVLLDEVSDALRAAGLVPASPWASPARRVAVRMEAGAVLDLVDVEAVDECVERGGPGLGHLGPTASARRLCRRITRSGIVRLVDVADAEVLHLRRLPDALAHDRHARAGWSALEDVRAHLASRRGGPVAMPWRVGPRRRPPRVVLTEAVHRVAVPVRGP